MREPVSEGAESETTGDVLQDGSCTAERLERLVGNVGCSKR